MYRTDRQAVVSSATGAIVIVGCVLVTLSALLAACGGEKAPVRPAIEPVLFGIRLGMDQQQVADSFHPMDDRVFRQTLYGVSSPDLATRFWVETSATEGSVHDFVRPSRTLDDVSVFYGRQGVNQIAVALSDVNSLDTVLVGRILEGLGVAGLEPDTINPNYRGGERSTWYFENCDIHRLRIPRSDAVNFYIVAKEE